MNADAHPHPSFENLGGLGIPFFEKNNKFPIEANSTHDDISLGRIMTPKRRAPSFKKYMLRFEHDLDTLLMMQILVCLFCRVWMLARLDYNTVLMFVSRSV